MSVSLRIFDNLRGGLGFWIDAFFIAVGFRQRTLADNKASGVCPTSASIGLESETLEAPSDRCLKATAMKSRSASSAFSPGVHQKCTAVLRFLKIGGTREETEANRPVFIDFHVPMARGTAAEAARDIGT